VVHRDKPRVLGDHLGHGEHGDVLEVGILVLKESAKFADADLSELPSPLGLLFIVGRDGGGDNGGIEETANEDSLNALVHERHGWGGLQELAKGKGQFPDEPRLLMGQNAELLDHHMDEVSFARPEVQKDNKRRSAYQLDDLDEHPVVGGGDEEAEEGGGEGQTHVSVGLGELTDDIDDDADDGWVGEEGGRIRWDGIGWDGRTREKDLP
jgi:hypothetical protein